MGIVEELPASRPPYSPPRPIEAGDMLDAFDCGKSALNDFLTQRALKNEGKSARTYVVTTNGGEDAGQVIAYYSLAAGAILHDDLPGWARRNMPDPVPVIVLGRLAVSARHMGHGLGSALLRDALQRALEASLQVGVRAIVVHAIDDEALSFYTTYGFQRFPTDGRTLFLPIETIHTAL